MGSGSLEVTKDLLARAVLRGACNELPSLGSDVMSLPQAMAVWAEENELLTESEISELRGDGYESRGRVPLSLLAMCGSVDVSRFAVNYEEGDGFGGGLYGSSFARGSGNGYGTYGVSCVDGDGYGLEVTGLGEERRD